MIKKTQSYELQEGEYLALAEFRYQIRRFLRHMESAVTSVGLNPQEYQLLLAIKGLPRHITPSISVFAERLQLNHNTMVELVDRCQDKGLIRRYRSAADRRHVVISLTAEGEASLRKLASAARRELNEIGPLLVKAMKQLSPGTSTQANVRAATKA